MDEVLGTEAVVHGGGQIAIRWAHNESKNVIYEYHIDGVPDGKNGVTGQEIDNFTALIGVFLNDIPRPYGGNLVVWPGSHTALESYFRECGPKAMSTGTPKLALGQSVQIDAAAGDVVLCHYGLAHTVAGNTTDVDRIAVYFRLAFKDIAQHRWEHLTQNWRGWKIAPAKNQNLSP